MSLKHPNAFGIARLNRNPADLLQVLTNDPLFFLPVKTWVCCNEIPASALRQQTREPQTFIHRALPKKLKRRQSVNALDLLQSWESLGDFVMKFGAG
jgi:hypothetical protein